MDIPLSPTRSHENSLVASASSGHMGGSSRRSASDAHIQARQAENVRRGGLLGRLRNYFHYETQAIVKIRNKKVSLLNFALQILILFYIGFYGLYIKKGYQKTGQAIGSSHMNLTGVGYTNSSQPWYGPDSPTQFQIFDEFDLMSPSLENDALFVTTNIWMTLNQTRGQCILYDTKNNACKSDADCVPLAMTPTGGRQVGGPNSCWFNHTDPQQPWPGKLPQGGMCLVFAWCPTEFEIPPAQNAFDLEGVNNFTVYARMDVHYPDFHQHLDNSGGNSDSLMNGLNTWTLEQMVQATGYEWEDVNNTGILMAMESEWDCNYDPHSKLSSGYNFRTVQFLHDVYGARELTKRYGIRLIILMHGVGSQADAVAALTAIGAGIGLLSVATLVADFIATKLLAARNYYNGVKYKEVDIQDEGAFSSLHDDAPLPSVSRQISLARQPSSGGGGRGDATVGAGTYASTGSSSAAAPPTGPSSTHARPTSTTASTSTTTTAKTPLIDRAGR